MSRTKKIVKGSDGTKVMSLMKSGGMAVQYRLDRNREVIAVIDAELKRRGHWIDAHKVVLAREKGA